jgi:hypothetical protein
MVEMPAGEGIGMSKNRWSGEKHPLHLFFAIQIPSPTGISTKKGWKIRERGRGEGRNSPSGRGRHQEKIE